MSCYGCSKKYGIFCKEYGCPNCGYSYCSKCLNRPMEVPRQGGKKLNVCIICYEKLTKAKTVEKVIDCESLPEIVGLNRSRRPLSSGSKDAAAAVALFDEEPPTNLGEVLMPITPAAEAVDTAENSNADSSEITENLDSVITKRLKNLKTIGSGDGAPSASTEDDIRARLEKLSGLPQRDYNNHDLLFQIHKSDQEQANNLLEEYSNIVKLERRASEERMNAISDIERRLHALRAEHSDMERLMSTPKPHSDAFTVPGSGVSFTGTPVNADTPSDNENSETRLQDVIEKILAESKLPATSTEALDELEPLPLPHGTKPSDMQELPWCNICNEDAVYRCKGCDGELFCAPCFRECHDRDEDYRVHIKEDYKAPPNFKDDHF